MEIDMQVFKVVRPFDAFVFRVAATETGNNFSELEKDVVASGGTCELVDGHFARIWFEGREHVIKVGHALVIGMNGGTATMIDVDTFERDFESVDKVNVSSVAGVKYEKPADSTKTKESGSKRTKAGGVKAEVAGDVSSDESVAKGDGK